MNKPFLHAGDKITAAGMLARGACAEGVREFCERTGLYSGTVAEVRAAADVDELDALDGNGYGDGNGCGYGSGSAYGSACGSGDDYGNGNGCGYGYGYVDGSGSGSGDGDGYGDGSAYGDGSGAGIDMERLA